MIISLNYSVYLLLPLNLPYDREFSKTPLEPMGSAGVTSCPKGVF